MPILQREHPMMSTPAHTAHDLPRAAAAAFARLRRSPGRGETWPQPVLRALERDRPATYGRLRRRLGLSQRLAILAGLGPAERAAIALACLFRDVADDRELTSRTAGRAWNEYFLRHETWLAPCFAIAETLRVADWPEDESLASVVGRMAYRFDIATLDERKRPLHVLEALPDQAQSKL
ncbi:MAG: hypothetical protein HY723_04210, partial [Chloroflexi bacterium]|nr:hypothetical protein [Chloroflexota bacterium]